MSWIDECEITFECKNILDVSADGLVCTIATDLAEYGKLSKKLFSLGKNSLDKDLTVLRDLLSGKPFQLGEALSLICKNDYNINNYSVLILTAMWSHESEYSKNLFYKAYINIFRQAFKSRLKSIVIPIMAYDGHLEICGTSIYEVLKDLNALENSHQFPLRYIKFMSTQIHHIDYFNKIIEPKIYRI